MELVEIKLCPSCRMKVEKQKETKDLETSCEGDDAYDDAEAMEQEITLEADKNELNFSFEEVNVGPVKVSYGKRKVSQLQHKLKEKHSRIQKKIANVLNVAPEEIECSEQENAISEEMKKKARDLDRIVELMKDQIQISPRKTKIQVLTMTHSSWSVRKTAEVFDVSNYIVRKAFRLREEKCILATPEAKKGSVLTSHGKSPCDGIGGTVKRLVARASLQRPYDKQLLPAQEVFTFCKEEIKGIEFIFISQADMEITRTTLELRYTNAKTVPGTRSFHHFVNKDDVYFVSSETHN